MKRTWYRVRFDEVSGCEVKGCSRCHVEKPVAEFRPRSAKGDGYRPKCKVCETEARAEAHAANPELGRARVHRYAAAHPDRVSAQYKRWYDANRDYVIRRVDEWRVNNHDRWLDNKRARETPETWARWNRTRAARGYFRAWAAANPDKCREADKRYRQRHRELRSLRNRLRQYAIRATAGTHLMTKSDIIARDGPVCYLCDQLFPAERLTIEHVIPLSRGGGHTPDNLRVACQPCNCRKGAKLPEL